MTVRGVACCLGIAAALSLWIPFSPWIFLLPPAAWALRKRVGPWPLALTLAFCFVQVRTLPGPRDLRRLLPDAPRTVQLEIRVEGDARVVSFREGHRETRAPVTAERLHHQGIWRPVSGRIQVRVEGEREWIPGSHYEVLGALVPADQPHAGLRRAKWILRTDPANWTSLSSRRPQWPRRFFRVRHHLASRIEALSPEASPAAGVLQALLLGRRVEVEDHTMRTFARTGLVHIFAISGLHLGLIATVLVWLARRIRFPYRYHILWVLPWLLLFTLCTGVRASSLRALIMITVWLSARLAYRRPNALNALCVAAVCILLLAPEQIADVGFQFSFLLVGGLLTIGGEVDAWLRARCARDPWAPVSTWERRFDRKLKDPLLRGLGVSFVCLVLAAPLTAHTFNLFSPVGLVGNLPAVPLVFLLLILGFPALPLLAAPDPVAALALRPARWCAETLLDWVNLLEHIPGGVHWVRSPPVWMVVACYALAGMWIARPRQRPWIFAGALALAGYAGTEAWLHHRRAELVVVDAGRGQAAWLRNRRGEVILIDCGSDWSGWNVARALREDGIDRIAALVFTHPDPRHVEGWREVFRHAHPREIWVAETDLDHPLFAELPLRPLPLSQGARRRVAGWDVQTLWPPADLNERSSDDRSLVLRFTDGFAAVLSMGGASERVETRLVESGHPLAARVWLAGHHRTRPGGSTAFLKRVRPDLSVISGTAFRGISPARETTAARLMKTGVPLFQLPPARILRVNPRHGTIYP